MFSWGFRLLDVILLIVSEFIFGVEGYLFGRE